MSWFHLGTIIVPKCNLKTYGSRAPTLWNAMSDDIRQVAHLQMFKTHLLRQMKFLFSLIFTNLYLIWFDIYITIIVNAPLDHWEELSDMSNVLLLLLLLVIIASVNSTTRIFHPHANTVFLFIHSIVLSLPVTTEPYPSHLILFP